MTTSYVNGHKDVVQKLVNAYVATLKWIQTHTGAQIADQVPPDYYAGVGKDAYAKALDSEKGIFNPTGMMPADGPKTCLAVLSAFNQNVKGKTIDLGARPTPTSSSRLRNRSPSFDRGAAPVRPAGSGAAPCPAGLLAGWGPTSPSASSQVVATATATVGR